MKKLKILINLIKISMNIYICYGPGGQISHCNTMSGHCIQCLRHLGKVNNTYLIPV